MATGSRQWIQRRRSTNVADYSGLNVYAGTLTADDVERNKLMNLNSKINIGIATETEVGLSDERYPVFVRIVPAGHSSVVGAVDTVAHYWRVVDSTGDAVPYSRRPDFGTQAISRLYEWVPDFDDNIWAYNEYLMSVATPPDGNWHYHPMYDADQKVFLDIAQLVKPSATQIADAVDALKRLQAMFALNNAHMYVKLADNRFMFCIPHGRLPVVPSGMTVDNMLVKEWFLTVMVNYRMIRLRYPNAPEGIITTAAYCIANNNRWGYYESYEHKEFAIMHVNSISPTEYEIENVVKPDGLVLPPEFDNGSKLDLSPIRASPQLIEVCNGLNAAAGSMHYLYNHTTGGSILSGTLLSMSMLYNLFDPDNRVFTPEQQTSIFYEALHNVNKRMIANLMIDRSKVYTYGRSAMSYPVQVQQLDTFMNIRRNSYPAGSHKAYICLIVLKKVMSSLYGVFLPWCAEVNNVINICENIMSDGARAHVGSGYYTGMPSKTQGAELDNYLPELAAYMLTFAKNDTLTMSPHLSPEVAARSTQTWTSMLNKVKSEDISATDPKIVRDFLETAGMVQFSFDPSDTTTWATAAAECKLAVARIDDVISNL